MPAPPQQLIDTPRGVPVLSPEAWNDFTAWESGILPFQSAMLGRQPAVAAAEQARRAQLPERDTAFLEFGRTRIPVETDNYLRDLGTADYRDQVEFLAPIHPGTSGSSAEPEGTASTIDAWYASWQGMIANFLYSLGWNGFIPFQ